jgi:hypothetical protein
MLKLGRTLAALAVISLMLLALACGDDAAATRGSFIVA